MERRKSKFQFPTDQERSQSRVGCLLMMKSNKIVYNTNTNSGKTSYKGASMMASTAPQSNYNGGVGCQVKNKPGEVNRFFLILDDNDEKDESFDIGNELMANDDERIS